MTISVSNKRRDDNMLKILKLQERNKKMNIQIKRKWERSK